MAEYGIQSVPDGMTADGGNNDKMAPTVAESIAMAMARQSNLQSDTFGAGSAIGDLMPIGNVTPAINPGVDAIDSFDEKPGVEA